MSEAYVALTIKVTDPSDDKFVAKHWAETISSAISTLMQTGGRANVYTSVIDETEAQAIVNLANYAEGVEVDLAVHAPQLPGDLMYAITTSGTGTLMLVNPDGLVLQETTDDSGESDEHFADLVDDMLRKELHEQYTRR